MDININNLCGIYYIKNSRTDTYYVGQSKSIRFRLTEHRKNLIKGIHCNPYLQSAWNLDEEYFEVGILEECAIEQLNEREEFHMLSKEKRYNILLPGEVPKWKETMSKEEFKARTLEGVKKRQELASLSKEEKVQRRKDKMAETKEKCGRAFHKSEAFISAHEKRRKEYLTRDQRENSACAKYKELYYNGQIIGFRNIRLFCEENGLRAKGITKVLSGKEKSYKGYTLPPGEREKLWQPKPRIKKEKTFLSEKTERIAKINAENFRRKKNGEIIHPTFIDPDGNEHVTNNISQLAEQFGLARNGLYHLKRGKFASYYGWSIKKD